MARVLLIGGGHIGTFTSRELHERGHDIAVIDPFLPVGYFALYGPQAKVPTFRCDARRSTDLLQLIRVLKSDCVIFAAGSSSLAIGDGEHWSNCVDLMGPRALEKLAPQAEFARLIVVSSRAVYGLGKSEPIPESCPACPISEYGRLKLQAETSIRRLAELNPQIQVSIVRCAGTYGPIRFGTGSRSAQFLDMIITSTLAHERITLRAHPEDRDEYLYIKDLAIGLRLLVEADIDNLPPILNMGTGRVHSATELAEAVREAIPGDGPDVVDDLDLVGRSRQPLSISLAERALGFRPQFPLAVGLHDYAKIAQ